MRYNELYSTDYACSFLGRLLKTLDSSIILNYEARYQLLCEIRRNKLLLFLSYVNIHVKKKK